MSSARNHKISALTAASIEQRKRLGLHCAAGRGKGGTCRNDSHYDLSYDFTKGRSGSTGHRVIHACPTHAVAFAEKHGITLVRDVEDGDWVNLKGDKVKVVEAIGLHGLRTLVLESGEQVHLPILDPIEILPDDPSWTPSVGGGN